MCYVITYGNYLLIWVIRIQNEIDLNTMEAECILLYHSVHEIIGIWEVIKDIQKYFISGKNQNPKYRTHSKVFVLNNILWSKVYEDN